MQCGPSPLAVPPCALHGTASRFVVRTFGGSVPYTKVLTGCVADEESEEDEDNEEDESGADDDSNA